MFTRLWVPESTVWADLYLLILPQLYTHMPAVNKKMTALDRNPVQYIYSLSICLSVCCDIQFSDFMVYQGSYMYRKLQF